MSSSLSLTSLERYDAVDAAAYEHDVEALSLTSLERHDSVDMAADEHDVEALSLTSLDRHNSVDVAGDEQEVEVVVGLAEVAFVFFCLQLTHFHVVLALFGILFSPRQDK